MKSIVKRVPVLGPFLMRVRYSEWNSSNYCEQRYVTGGNSGAGSYGRLAEFKAGFLNRFVDENRIASVIEFGCGDGAQLRLAHYESYIGVDKSAKAVETCRSIFQEDASKSFAQIDELQSGTCAELSLSLDVVYHLVEDAVFDEYMRTLFSSATRYVIVYASNMNQESPTIHVRHRQFTSWVEQNEPDWHLQSITKNIYPYDDADQENTSFADFYIFAPN